MHTTEQLLDAAKRAAGIGSDYKLGLILGMSSTSAVVNYRKGRSHPDDATCAKLAELAGLDVGYVLACAHAQRAKDEATRAVWESVAERLRGPVQAVGPVHIMSTRPRTPGCNRRPIGRYFLPSAYRRGRASPPLNWGSDSLSRGCVFAAA